ncbi:family 57 glycosyltransferase [Melampsora americana]|nr:family 57 glycosyltransferase [Melampsora americana]
MSRSRRREQDQRSNCSNSNRTLENQLRSEILNPTYQPHSSLTSSSSNRLISNSYSSQDPHPSTSSHSHSHSRSDQNLKPSGGARKMTSIKRPLADQRLKHSSSSNSLQSSILTSIPSPPPSLGFLKASRFLEQESITLQSRMEEACGAQSPIARLLNFWNSTGKPQHQILLSSIAIVLLLKLSVSLGSYSGFSQGPLFGDLEAQRHWMGLTLHHWGLDYPPLTAYHSWILAQFGRLFNPIFVALRPPHPTSDDLTGWGDLHDSLKVFLRWTVLGSDLIVWIPVVFLYCFITYNTHQENHSSHPIGSRSISKRKPKWTSAIHSALLILMNPNLILIDNGHFQYNSIMLGLTLAAIVSFHLDRDLLGAALYVCSMCFKQMALYYSPAIFAYLFGKCLYLRHTTGLTLFFKLAIISIITLSVAFLPFIVLTPFPATILQAIHRIFPLARGLFEDKVANFWCAANVVIKFRNLASVSTLAKVALLMTLLAVLPGLMVMIWVNWTLGSERSDEEIDEDHPVIKPGKHPRSLNVVPYTLFNASMAFYLFSFQVHEKTILLPILPLMMIMSQQYNSNRLDLNTDWEWTCLISNVACFSMWPLLKKDNLHCQYVTLQVLYNYLIGYNPIKLVKWTFIDYLTLISYFLMGLIHLGEMMIGAPDRLPDLYIVMNLSLSFGIFGLSYLWSLHRLIEEGWGLIGFMKKGSSSRSSGMRSSEGKSEGKLTSKSNTISSLHSRVESISNPEMIFIEEEEGPRDPLKNKRATSLQARPKKSIHQLLSRSNERAGIRSRSLGGTSLVTNLKGNSKMKRMISSPGAEKLMNRIRNRVNSEQVNGNGGIGSGVGGSHKVQRMLTKEEGKGNRSSLLGEEVADLRRGESGSEEEEEEEEFEGSRSESKSSTLESKASREARVQTRRSEEGEGRRMKNGTRASSKIEVIEQDWEMALRQSREGAIARRREELRSKGLSSSSSSNPNPNQKNGGRVKLKLNYDLMSDQYVDAIDLVNGPLSRR